MRTAYGITILRVSDGKGVTIGDSHENQEEQIDHLIKRTEAKDSVKIRILERFPYVGSGQVDQELQPLFKVLQQAKKLTPKPEYAFIKSVDRATRASGEMMLFLYDLFKNADIKLIDSYGVIQDYSFNTLEHTGFEYKKWSIKNPARKMIYMEGERSKEDVTDILSRMIGAEIRFVRLGYAVGSAPYGLKNVKVRTEHGLRSVWAEHEEEVKYVRKIHELSLEGMEDSKIIMEINGMGYKSRIENRYDKNDVKKIHVIGEQGGKPLNKKELDRIRQNPSYAAIMTHEWLKSNKNDIKRYVRAKHFNGIITIDNWNRINRGKFTIVNVDGEYKVLEATKDPVRVKKDPHNPIVPFKNVIGCPVDGCGKSLGGSAPRNGSGGHTRQYHHAWNHDYWGINADKLEEQIYKFLDGIEFKPDVAMKIRAKLLSFWEAKRSRIVDDSLIVATQLQENAFKQQQLKDTIKLLKNPSIIAMMEDDMNVLLLEEEDLKQLQNKKQEEKIDTQRVINRVTHYLEHIGETIKNERDTRVKEALFAILFEERPTVSDLYFGTAKLACVFKLKEAFKKELSSQIPVSDPTGARTRNQKLKRLLLYH